MASSKGVRKGPASDERKAVRGLASRILNLLGPSGGKPEANAYLIATLDDLLGAVYSLHFATELGFQDRPKHSVEKDAIRRRARTLAGGNARHAGPWMAGLHLNSAVFRLAAVYHRSLKLVTGNITKKIDVPDLVDDAEQLFLKWTGHSWSRQNISKIYDQANTLKHSTIAQFYKRKGKYWHTRAATSEVIDLLDAWWRAGHKHDA